jgi:hypothetical protein
MPKASKSSSGKEEDPPNHPSDRDRDQDRNRDQDDLDRSDRRDWVKVDRRKDKGKAKSKSDRDRRDLDRDGKSLKGSSLTKQTPKESESEHPTRTTSLGGKRNWASDSDSDGQSDPKKMPTRRHTPLPKPPSKGTKVSPFLPP